MDLSLALVHIKLQRSYLVLTVPHTHLCTWPAGVGATPLASAMIASGLAGLTAGRAGAPSMAGLVAGMPTQQVSAACLGTCSVEVVAARHWRRFTDVCSKIPQGKVGLAALPGSLCAADTESHHAKRMKR